MRISLLADSNNKRYSKRGIETDDIRQVSGYGRLKDVRKRLAVSDHTLIPCLIVYPDLEGHDEIPPFDLWPDEGRYLDVYKLGIKIPLI